MTDTHVKNHKEAADWLTCFARELDSDPDMIEAMPIEDVRDKLRALGADVQRFHARVANLIDAGASFTPLSDSGNVIPLFWEPEGAGMPLAAAPASVTQEHQFETQAGVINISCAWGGATGNEPAFIWMAWDAHLSEQSEFEIRLIHPDTRAIRYEIRPGRIYRGDQTFTQQEIGFDPLSEKWGLSVLITESAK